MAEDIVFTVDIDPGGKGGQSLTTLKAEFKNLQKELAAAEVGTEKYNKTLQKLGAVKDELGDLRNTINALNPEGKVQAFANVAGKLAGGFQAATGAAALFGVQSEELEKQLLRVQAATALAQGIQSVVGLGDAFRVLGAVIQSNPLMVLATVIIGVTTAIIGFTRENEKATNSIDDQKIALDNIKASYDEHIALLEASGSAYEDIAVAKVESFEAEIAQLEILKKEYDELFRISEEGSEEQKKAEIEWTKVSNEQAQLRGLIKLEFAKADKFIRDRDIKDAEEAEKKRNDRAKAEHEARLKEKKDLEAQYLLASEEQQKEFDEIFKQLEAEQQEADLQAFVDFEYRKMLEGLAVEEAGRKMKKEADDAARAKKDKADAEELQNRLKQETLYFSAASDLSSVFFNVQLARAKGNAVEEEKIRKKQFQADKALRASQAIINTLEGITAAAPNVPLQIATGIMGALAVAKILSTQYTGTPSGGSVDVNTGGAPQIQTQAPTLGTPSTRLNEAGQNQSTIRAVVVETDITDSQDRVRRLKEQATF